MTDSCLRPPSESFEPANSPTQNRAARCSVKSRLDVNQGAETPAGTHRPDLAPSTSALTESRIARECRRGSIIATAARPASSLIGRRRSLASRDPLPRCGPESIPCSFKIIFTVCREILLIGSTTFVACKITTFRVSSHDRATNGRILPGSAQAVFACGAGAGLACCQTQSCVSPTASRRGG